MGGRGGAIHSGMEAEPQRGVGSGRHSESRRPCPDSQGELRYQADGMSATLRKASGGPSQMHAASVGGPGLPVPGRGGSSLLTHSLSPSGVPGTMQAVGIRSQTKHR